MALTGTLCMSVGAVVAFNTPGVSMLEGRSHIAVLWDIRMRPEARSSSVEAKTRGGSDPVEGWSHRAGTRADRS